MTDKAPYESSQETGFAVSGTVTATPETPDRPESDKPDDDALHVEGGESTSTPDNPAPVFPLTGNVRHGNTKADDLQPLLNQFVQINAGDHQGQRGVYISNVEHDDKGLPTRVLVKIRDLTYDHEYVVVGYDEIQATAYNGGR